MTNTTGFFRALLLGTLLVLLPSLSSAAPTFVQRNFATPQAPVTSVAVPYTGAQTAGNANALVIGWNDTTSTPTSVVDSAGNAYLPAVPTFRGSGLSQAIYFAANIKSAAAGGNTVTVTFNQAAKFVDLRIAEYSGLSATSPFDVGRSAAGTASTASSGAVTTTAATELIVGGGITTGGFKGAGTSFTSRVITPQDGDILEDRSVTATGSYAATAPVDGSWIMQVATFKAATGGGGDVTPPTVTLGPPANGASLAATTTVGATALDNVGVAGVQFLLDGASLGAEDTASPYSVSWDTTTATNGTHALAARARDAAGNVAVSTSVSVVVDNQPPTGSVQINAGAAATNSANVTLNLSATDLLSPVTQMRFSNTGTSFGTAVAYATTAAWALSTGAGTKTVYAQFQDAAGNWSASFTDTIVFDPTPPAITAVATTNITTSSGTISWTTDEPATSQVDFGLTTSYGTTTTLDPTLVTAHTLTLVGLSPGTAYNYRVRSRDAAGNEAVGSNNTFTTTTSSDTTPPTVSITAPANGSTVSGTVAVTANASDTVGVVGAQFLVDGANLGAEATSAPYSASWNSAAASNGTHTISARARDAAGNAATATISVTSSNAASPAGPVQSYSFDEGAGTLASDSSGNGNTATLNNGVAWATGRYGSAISLDGVNDNLTVPNSASTDISGTALTLSMWINPQALNAGSDSVLIAKPWNPTGTAPYYQYGLELGGGTRSDFYIGTASGLVGAPGGANLPQNQWSHLAVTFDGSQVRTYLNGTLVSNKALSASITARGNAMSIGSDARPTQFAKGLLDDLRIYNRVLTQAEIQTDMTTPLGGTGSGDSVPPTVAISAPANGAQVGDIVTITADAADNVGVAGVQFYVDGAAVGFEDTAAPYGVDWDTRSIASGSHTITARARDAAGNGTFSPVVNVTVANTSFFQNEILATGFNLPTNIEFLPDGRMLVGELAGVIKVLAPPYTQPNPTPFLIITNIGSAGVQQGIFDIALDPQFASNHYYYVFYTAGSPNRDRLSRFTANANLDGTIAGSELVLYQDSLAANAEHHGGAINFGNDGKIYFTTGEEFNAPAAQDLTSPRGKLHRINPDGSVPTDNPFYDGAGPNVDSVWALGLRNPYRAYFDAPTNRLLIGDVGGNDYSTAEEEVDLGIRGANYGWPNCELGTCGNPAYTPALYAYPHNGRDAAITGGFVYHGSQFPASYQGSYFFADYTQNWIRRLTFDASGNVNGVLNFEPPDGSVDGPYGDIVYLAEGPDGALYYVDLGYSDIGATYGVSKIRRIRFIQSNQQPVAAASASPLVGQAPLTVSFSSAGSVDPEGQPITYAWTFGDGGTSTEANPQHVYAQVGRYTVRLTVSDGVNGTIASPLSITVGTPPVGVILSPQDGRFFLGGDVISFSGDGMDSGNNILPASAFAWNIDFLHEGHVHPGVPITGVKSGSFAIPVTGHDFSGNTRYRFTLTVTDANGLTSATSVIIWPTKVNLSFDSAPSGLTLYLDGIAKLTPFVYDTLVSFNHSIEARNQSTATTNYTFASWSDGGAQTHTITVPAAAQSYTATYTTSPNNTPITAGESNVLSADDSGNANLLIVQSATLSQAATLKSLSFYVNTANGNLRLGIYDATGPGGGPGALMAQTNAFAPVFGWNTANVITPVSLPAGNYWLAYLPSSNSLHFAADFTVGSYKYASFAFGPMPATFPAIAGQGTTHWSLYGTLTVP